MECLFVLAGFCSLLRAVGTGGSAEMKQVNGVLGKNILLESGNSADLNGHEVVWEFTTNNGTEFTILDVGPNHLEVKPNKYFEDRLNFTLSTGDLLLYKLRTSDQGIYIISVDGRGLRKIYLRIFGNTSESADAGNQAGPTECWQNSAGHTTSMGGGSDDVLYRTPSSGDAGYSADDILIGLTISALVFSSLHLIVFLSLTTWKIKSNRELLKGKWWLRVLNVCNTLQFVFILAASSFLIGFKDANYLHVAIASIICLLLSTLILPFITRRCNCQRIGRFSNKTGVIWNSIQCALHAIMICTWIAFLIKDIHQKKQGRIFHTWNVLIASAVICTVSFLLALMFNSWRNKININEKGPQNAEELQSLRTFRTEAAGSVLPH